MRRSKWLIIIIATAVMMGLVGCTDEKSTNDKENTEENAKESNQDEEKFSVGGLSEEEVKKADKASLNFFQAYAEEDTKKLAKYYLSETMLDYDLKHHGNPKYIESLGEKYVMIRYGNLYNIDGKGRMIYHIYQPDYIELKNSSMTDDLWITIRKDEKGKWKSVSNGKGSFSVRVQPDEVKNINSGTILHDVPDKYKNEK